MIERENIRTIMLRNPSEANNQELALKQRKAKQIIRKIKRMSEKTRIESIENSYKNNTKQFIEKANGIKNSFKPRSTIISSLMINLKQLINKILKEETIPKS